jgi:hypothetical protein
MVCPVRPVRAIRVSVPAVRTRQSILEIADPSDA